MERIKRQQRELDSVKLEKSKVKKGKWNKAKSSFIPHLKWLLFSSSSSPPSMHRTHTKLESQRLRTIKIFKFKFSGHVVKWNRISLTGRYREKVEKVREMEFTMDSGLPVCHLRKRKGKFIFRHDVKVVFSRQKRSLKPCCTLNS